MATTKAHSSITTVKNNGATLVGAGNVDTSGPITKVLQVNDIADDFGLPFGSKVVANDGTGAATTDRVGVSGINPSVALGYNASASEWLIRGVATTIGGVSNNVLLSKGSDYDGSVKDNIFELNHTHTLGSGNGTFDFYARSSTDITPNYTKGGNAGAEQNFVQVDGSTAATDDAATPTRSVPGELTYRFGGPLPVNDDYKAKNVFEA